MSLGGRRCGRGDHYLCRQGEAPSLCRGGAGALPDRYCVSARSLPAARKSDYAAAANWHLRRAGSEIDGAEARGARDLNFQTISTRAAPIFRSIVGRPASQRQREASAGGDGELNIYANGVQRPIPVHLIVPIVCRRCPGKSFKRPEFGPMRPATIWPTMARAAARNFRPAQNESLQTR